MKVQINDRIHVSEIRREDKPAYLKYLADREISERTLTIPYPYTATDADEWLECVVQSTAQQGEPTNFAIRQADDELIGSVGFMDLQRGHKAELGYWLAKPFWGQGIVTAVVGRLCQYAVDRWQLIRITAHVFAFNPGSARVLEKNGFEQEGILRKHHRKGDQFIDAMLFAWVSDDSSRVELHSADAVLLRTLLE